MASKRVDPRERSVSAIDPRDKVENRDPDMHYVGVSTLDPYAVQIYEARGYSPVLSRAGGAKWRGGKVAHDGQEQVNFGMLLMALEMDKFNELVQHGVPGECGGQDDADLIEKQMIHAKGEFDPMRGIGGGQYLRTRPYDPSNPGNAAVEETVQNK